MVEDAHWADPALLDLVDYTLAFSGGAAILLLCLARPELLEAAARLGRAAAPTARCSQLEPLDGADARALVDALADGLDAAAAERIVATAEGNPLFLEQLLAVRAEGDARRCRRASKACSPHASTASTRTSARCSATPRSRDAASTYGPPPRCSRPTSATRSTGR